MTTMNYRSAITEAIARAMRSDPTVVLLGEDIAAAGGAFKTTAGLLDEFGPQRVWDTPISEQAIIGAAIGAAMRGLKPIAEIMFADFLATCWDGIVNHAAKLRYMSNGRLSAPIVIRVQGGAGLGFGAQHSQLFDNMAMAVPGLKIVTPATPADVIGLFQSAIDDPDPVVFIEHKALLELKEDVPDEPFTIPLGQAKITRAGTDLTIVAVGAMVRVALGAADQLSNSGFDAEVIDLRTLSPLDMPTVLASVRRTSRLVIVEEGPGVCGWGSEVAAQVAQQGLNYLDAPIGRVTSPPTPTPFAGNLEMLWLPSPERVVAEVKSYF